MGYANRTKTSHFSTLAICWYRSLTVAHEITIAKTTTYTRELSAGQHFSSVGHAGQIGADVHRVCGKQCQHKQSQDPTRESQFQISAEASPRDHSDPGAHDLNRGHQWPCEKCSPKKRCSKFAPRRQSRSRCQTGRRRAAPVINPGPSDFQTKSYPAGLIRFRQGKSGSVNREQTGDALSQVFRNACIYRGLWIVPCSVRCYELVGFLLGPQVPRLYERTRW